MLDQAALVALHDRARRDVDEGRVPSCQLAVARHGEVLDIATFGDPPDGDATRYVIFSCTKALVAAAVWQLLGEGSLRLDDRVADLVPAFGTNGKDAVTVEQVLLHTGGFPSAPLGPPAWATREGRLEAFGRWRLNWEPGSRFEYHPTSGHWVLAELLTTIDGADHREVVRRRVLEPLGLKALALGVEAPDQHDLARIVLTGEPPTPEEFEAALGVPGIDLGEVTDDALVTLGGPEAVAVGVPGGGAISTAADLATFYQALLDDHLGLWDPAILASATGEIRNRFPDLMAGGIPANRSIGLMIDGGDGSGVRHGFGYGCSARAFGHDGAGGQLAWADPATGLSFAYLTNGIDRHLLRQARRNTALSSRAAATAVAG